MRSYCETRTIAHFSTPVFSKATPWHLAPVFGLQTCQWLPPSLRRREKGTTAPTRQSSRVRGIGPDGSLAAGIDRENADGSVTLVAGGYEAPKNEPKARHPKGARAVDHLSLLFLSTG